MSTVLEAFRFDYNGQTWRWTSADADQAYGGETFTALDGLGREDLEQTGEAARVSLAMRMPATAQPAILFRDGVPDGVIRIQVLRFAGGAWFTIFRGRVLACSFDGIKATLTAEPWFTALAGNGPRRTCGPSCPHDFCDHHCQLAEEDWTATGRAESVDGTTVALPEAAEFPDGTFTGGVFAWGYIRREVLAHSGSALTLARAISGLGANDYVSVLAGCDKTTDTCSARSNLVNHGGCPNVPSKNPTSGDPIM